MNKIFRIATCVVYVAFSMMFMPACIHEKNELAHDHNHEHEHGENRHHDHDAHDGHDHGAGNEITLEPEQAERMGVKTTVVSQSTFTDAIHTTASVISAPSATGVASAQKAGIFTFAKGLALGSSVKRGQAIGSINSSMTSAGDTNAAALATLNNAKRELDRLRPLYEKRLVTAEKYNNALAAYESAKAMYSPSASSGVVVAPISGIVTEIMADEGGFVETGEEIVRISDGSALNLIAQVPNRYASELPEINNAIVSLPSSKEVIDIAGYGGTRISSSTAVGMRPGYLPVVFSLPASNAGITAGSVVEIYLQGSPRGGVISVPLTALTEQQGNYFVYVKLDEEGYIKSPVKTGANNGTMVEILSGLHPGDEVVTEGVAALRLAETSGAVPEGHSHTH